MICMLLLCYTSAEVITNTLSNEFIANYDGRRLLGDPTGQPSSSPTRSCPMGSEGPFCNDCMNGYFLNPLKTNTCSECDQPEVAGYSVFAIIFIGICLLLYGFKVYQETSTVSIYAHDLYHTDTWLVKFKIHQLEEKIRLKYKKNVRMIESAAREASEQMLEYDREMESKIDTMWCKLKIYASFFQVVALLPLITGDKLNNMFQTLTVYLSIINFDFSRTFSLQCLWDYDFVDVLISMTTCPIIICGIILGCYHYYVDLSAAPLNIRKTGENRCLVAFFVWTFLTLPAATNAIFQMLVPCTNIPSPYSYNEYRKRYRMTMPSYLPADGSISCSSERYKFGVKWASVMVVVYCVILPGIYIYLLVQKGHMMKTRNNTIYALDETKTNIKTNANGEQVVNYHATRRRQVTLQPLKFLYAAYHPQYYYWEVFETIRRILLCGVIVVCQHGKTLQIVAACMICVACIILHEACDPYLSPTLSLSNKITQWQLFGLFFVMLLANDEEFSDTRDFGLDLVMILILVGGFIVELLVLFMPSRWYSSKPQYIAIHTEIQKCEDEESMREFDDDIPLNLPADLQNPAIMSRNNSSMGNILLQNVNGGSVADLRSAMSLSRAPSQRALQEPPKTPESLQHWTMQQSNPPFSRQVSMQSVHSDRSQTPLLSHKQPNFQESKESPNRPSLSRSGSSQYFLRGPALEHAFHQEIQKYAPVTIKPNATPTVACNELDAPSFGQDTMAGRGRNNIDTQDRNAIDDLSKQDVPPVDDRQRKFTTPHKAVSHTPHKVVRDDVSAITAPSLNDEYQESFIDMGDDGVRSSVPSLNRSRGAPIASDEATKLRMEREAELLALKEEMLFERGRLMKENERMK